MPPSDFFNERMALAAIRGVVSTLPEDDRILCESMAQSIRNIASMNGKLGSIALILVGAEWAAKL
jgi:hypothetical protein